MSYCVNCGVELDKTAVTCPLCHTIVANPFEPVDILSPRPFPSQKGEVLPPSRWEMALLLSAMFFCVGVCCGVLNLFLRTEHMWSLYVIGAVVMLWIWLVPPLLMRGMHLCLRLLLDVVAVGIYVFLISVDLNGSQWFIHLALPIILLGGAIMLFLGLILRGGGRSILSSVTLIIGSIGVFMFGVELFIDRYLLNAWEPGWSIVILAVSVSMVIPLIIVRHIPALREEVRRRFHM